MRRTLALLLTVAIGGVLYASDPRSAIGEARQSMNAGQYDRAIQTLQAAIPTAAEIANPEERAQALAALHFYSAMAFAKLQNDGKAREQLEEFFRFSPQTNAIDPAKFDAHFVALFNEVARAGRVESATSFEAVYPGYRTYATDEPRETPVAKWQESPEMLILATDEERSAWKHLRDDLARQNFIDDFWARRDPNPDAEGNEFRDEFERRVAFANYIWGSEQSDGAMTDRGRIFVLFGPPDVIRIKPLTEREGAISRQRPVATSSAGGAPPSQRATWQGIDARQRNPLGISATVAPKGSVERWIYSREKLPTLQQVEVVFKFVTDEGYGDHVLQREFWVLNAIQEATKLKR